MAVIELPEDRDDPGNRATPAEPPALAVQESADGGNEPEVGEDQGQHDAEQRHHKDLSPNTVAWAAVINVILTLIIAAGTVLAIVLSR